MNVLEIEAALLWCSNKTATENAQMLNAHHYSLLAQNKKTQNSAQKLFRDLVKTKQINPKKRPSVLQTLMSLAQTF